MAVTPDEYELPIAVADTPRELSRMTGIAAAHIRDMICKHKPGTTLGIRFIKVVEEEDD